MLAVCISFRLKIVFPSAEVAQPGPAVPGHPVCPSQLRQRHRHPDAAGGRPHQGPALRAGADLRRGEHLQRRQDR